MNRRTLALLIGSLLAVPPASTADEPLPNEALELLACAREVAGTISESVWPGWGEAPFSILLVAGESEYVVCPPAGLEGFSAVRDDGPGGCSVLRRERHFDPSLLATFPAFSSEPTIVVGTPEATGMEPAGWVLTVLHEHFHQLQYSRPWYYEATEGLGLSGGDETGMWMLDYPFPYDEPAVVERFDALAAALGATLEARGTAELAPELRRFEAAWRDFREGLAPDDYSYFRFQLWQEGVARYVELRAAELLAEASEPACFEKVEPGASRIAEELRSGIEEALGEPRLAENRRVAFYAVGAAVALLLDETSPGWKELYLERPFEMEAYFAP